MAGNDAADATFVPSAQSPLCMRSLVPALRKVREGRGTLGNADASQINSLDTTTARVASGFLWRAVNNPISASRSFFRTADEFISFFSCGRECVVMAGWRRVVRSKPSAGALERKYLRLVGRNAS